HRGFSMVELVLVMAILVVIAGLAIGHLGRSQSGQYLIRGADLVRSEMGRARVQAIRSGEIHAFFYQPGSNVFAVARLSDAGEITVPNSQLIEGQYQFFHQRLPSDIVFAETAIEFDSRDQMSRQQVRGGGGVGSNNEMRSVMFYGDGSSQNARITLAHTSGASIQITLRGLTGVASSSNVVFRGE
ncbi:MAG TPA: prepilin-type N-terminal cleavage/methylation domain-containing protein, partial [Pirellulaceae bacterium]|nr:prepilin-type N-terminal cleavage/methylation domain-containing protein [Pirellulaceae bacterium]